MEADVPGCPSEDEDLGCGAAPAAAPASNVTLRDILSSIAKRKRTGVPMPSSEQRRLEKRKRRLAERAATAEGSASQADNASGSGESCPNAATSADGSSRSDGAQPPERGATDAPASAGEASESGAPSAGSTGDNTVVAPQVTLDEDGNIVIDKESLVVTAAVESVNDSERADVVTVNNNDPNRRVTSASFVKRDASTRWSSDDNAKFYQALSKYGTDFALLQRAFPGRSRRQIKTKFKREERENLDKVNRFLRLRTPMSLEDTRKELGLTGGQPSGSPDVGSNAPKDDVADGKADDGVSDDHVGGGASGRKENVSDEKSNDGASDDQVDVDRNALKESGSAGNTNAGAGKDQDAPRGQGSAADPKAVPEPCHNASPQRQVGEARNPTIDASHQAAVLQNSSERGGSHCSTSDSDGDDVEPGTSERAAVSQPPSGFMPLVEGVSMAVDEEGEEAHMY